MTKPQPNWTVLEVLDWTKKYFGEKGIEGPRLDAEILLAHVLQCERIMLYAHFDRPMAGAELAKMRSLVAKRAQRTPIAYLTGVREFWSIPLAVNEHVLVPRPETETLIEVVLERAPHFEKCVDVGAGSGAIAIALAKERPDAKIWGLELNEDALKVALSNGKALSNLSFLQSDLFQNLPSEAQPLDVVAANLPYIPSGEIERLAPEVKTFEPRLALDGGRDGLDAIHKVIALAPRFLGQDGLLALESGTEQVEAICAALASRSYRQIDVRKDMAGLPRITSAVAPPPVATKSSEV